MVSETCPVVVVGAGFAGVRAALAAQRLGSGRLRVTLVAPQPVLEMRPRLYEANPASMAFDLRPTLDAAGVSFVRGEAIGIDARASQLRLADGGDIAYGRLVVATGSRMAVPDVGGLQHAYSIDTVDEAQRVEARLHELAAIHEPSVAVVGAGFAGIELALELRPRVRQFAGHDAAERLRITLIDRATAAGQELGSRVRPVIESALAAGRVALRMGADLLRLEPRAVVLRDGTTVGSDLTILCTGLRAAPFTQSLDAPRGPDGRLMVDSTLRVAGVPGLFAAGDAARAEAAPGRWTLLSCQHARGTGALAGENAARDLLGMPLLHYAQPDYVTCLDLGDWGAVLTEGWEREPRVVGADAKAIKRRINTELIYPPRGTRNEVLAADHA